ncbi:hypothetical protein EVG20_g5514 [Dentipellis fragilis]|uniref:Uncharacterized protein n=1 Tax=Dentipellis fragilis TaxID=205917 RepID=A0A4Y9YV78_9AGAM|nr:hypothetical protein EVG20_g5514 [Dentipellis fragilis]
MSSQENQHRGRFDDEDCPPPTYRRYMSLNGPPTQARRSEHDQWNQFGTIRGPPSNARSSGSSRRVASAPHAPVQGDYLPASGHPHSDSPHPVDALGPCQLEGFTYTGKAVSNRDPLKPPPPSFSRLPNPECTYPPLPQPIRIPCQGMHLNSGFLPLFPAPQLLLAHDVQPSDISRLLEDCHIQGERNLAEDLGANAMLGMSLMPGLFAADAIMRAVTRKRKHKVSDLVGVWDEAFFAPRRLRASIEHEGLDGTTSGEEVESKGHGSDGVHAGSSREPMEKATRQQQQKEQKKVCLVSKLRDGGPA